MNKDQVNDPSCNALGQDNNASNPVNINLDTKTNDITVYEADAIGTGEEYETNMIKSTQEEEYELNMIKSTQEVEYSEYKRPLIFNNCIFKNATFN